MSSAITRLPCFSPIPRNRRFTTYGDIIKLRPGKVFRVLSSAEISNVNKGTPLNSTLQVKHGDGAVSQTVKAAKIHDFCLGIPFGGLVLGGGLVGLIFSKSPAASGAGVLIGGALLALSTLSLKVWRQGKSSLPFIFGQAVLSLALLWKNFQSYSLTPNIFPSGCIAAISAAMLGFYTYVVISGGNPPPKNLKVSESS